MITVRGRVRPAVWLKQDGAGAPCVVVTSWASDRPFPRTAGLGVAFEIETSDGRILRVDPFEALIALPVRRRARAGGVSREEAWLAVADEITVEGEALGDDVRAARIFVAATAEAGPGGGASQHRIPPRTLAAGEAERSAPAFVEPPTLAVVEASAAAAPTPSAPAEPPRAKGRRHRHRAPLPDPVHAQRGEGDKREGELAASPPTQPPPLASDPVAAPVPLQPAAPTEEPTAPPPAHADSD